MTIEHADRPCLEASEECEGPVEFFRGETFTTTFWPRCKAHGSAHVTEQGTVWDQWGELLAKPWFVTG